MRWRFLDTGLAGGPFNMALDEVLASQCAARRSPPVFRIYRWTPWTLSVGRMQNAARHLCLADGAAGGVPIVRRPTGGRSVFHAEELTYSFAAGLPDLPVAATVSEVYRFVAGALVAGLRSMGAEAHIWPGRRRELKPEDDFLNGPREHNADPRSARNPCFASVSQYEICVEGKKLVGSAQRRWPRAVLQHGSILLGPAHLRIADCVRNSSALGRGSSSTAEDHLRSHTITLGEILRRKVDTDELGAHLLAGAENVWGVTLQKDRIRPAERRAAEQLVKFKYGTDDWNLRGVDEVGRAAGTLAADLA